jgi:BirA family biotin operon repressor/biotin-[acetyl-CoA-carboxylase] ligase
MSASLDPAALHVALADTIFAGKIQVFPTIGSTNTHAMQQAQDGAAHGSVYVSEEQTAGRGRGAHAWHSEPHAGLYLSILVRPQMAPADALWLSLAAGLAVQAAVQNVTTMVADIRWPNDLLLNGRKFCGILTEMNAEATRVRHAVIGIGINVNHGAFPPELQSVATALRLECGQVVCSQDLLIALLREMNAELACLMEPRQFSSATHRILARMEAHSTWIRGKRVTVEEGGGYTGVTAGLNSLGFLQVETGNGLRTVLSGGVREAKG